MWERETEPGSFTRVAKCLITEPSLQPPGQAFLNSRREAVDPLQVLNGWIQRLCCCGTRQNGWGICASSMELDSSPRAAVLSPPETLQPPTPAL